MRVAICSSDGSNVNLHFGKTNTFYIFDIEHNLISLMEKREVGKYSPTEKFLRESGESHTFEQEKFDLVYHTISDCRKVYTVSIGDVPRQKLSEKGITVQLCDCPIDSISTCNGNCKSK